MPHAVNHQLLKHFGEKIKELRTARGLSQEALAELTGFHRTYIGMIERGERNLSVSNAAAFAEAFELPLADFFNTNSRGAK